MASGTCCKVSKITDKYGLESPGHVTGDLDEYLSAKWQGAGERSRASFRDLAEWFNKLVLQTAYRTHGRDAGSQTINTEYRVLNGDDGVEEYERVGLLTDLETDGIDGESVASDFVSHSTMARHIRDCLDVENTHSTPDRSSDPRDRVRRVTAQLETQVEKTLRPLATRDEVDGLDESDLETVLYLNCPHCPTRVRLDRALENGYVCADHHRDSPAAEPGDNERTL